MKRIFIFLILFVVPSLVFAQDYYVRSSGTNGNGLTYETAWVGLNNINWSSVDSGNGILYVDGVFTSALTVSVSGESGTPIYIKGYTSAASVRGVYINNYSYITIDGMIVEGVSGDSGVVVKNNANDITIKNNIIRNNEGNGIKVDSSEFPGPATDSGSASNLLIEGNDIYGNGTTGSVTYCSGIFFGMTYTAIIRNNTIHDNGKFSGHDHGIYAYTVYEGATGPSSGFFEIYGNTIYNHNYGMGMKVFGSADIYNNIVSMSETEGINTGHNFSQPITQNVWNNLVFNNGWSGIRRENSANVSGNIYNNTVYQNERTSTNSSYANIRIDRDEPSISIRNNIVVSRSGGHGISGVSQSNLTCSNNLIYGATGTNLPCSNTVSSNPLLVNPPSNFQLQAGSPAINQGYTIGSPYDIDILGVSRPAGFYDIGAYEYGGTPTPPPPPPSTLVPSPPAMIEIH